MIDEAEEGGLRVVQMVFHLVGPKPDEHFVRLEALHPGPFEAFFLDRIRSVLQGAPYIFSDASATRERLNRIAQDPDCFQAESEKLAEDFQNKHGGSAARGALIIFVVKTDSAQYFALLKYDDEAVLSYATEDAGEGRQRVTLEALERTFVQNREALQKSAIIRLTPAGGDLRVVDRRNPQKVARYFEAFLDATRVHQDASLTQKLVGAVRTLVRENRELVEPELLSQIAKRTYEAAHAGGAIGLDDHKGFLETCLGKKLNDDHPLAIRFARILKKERLDGVPFNLDGAAVRPPTIQRLVTAQNIQVVIPDAVRDLVEEVGDRIIIKDRVERRTDDPDEPRRGHRGAA